MCILLEQADADLTRWSGSNDGRYIPTNVCKDWAKCLRESTSKLMVMSTPDDTYSGGTRQWPIIGDFAKAIASIDPFESIRHHFAVTGPATWTIEPATEDDRRFVEDFAFFLESCGGCRQY